MASIKDLKRMCEMQECDADCPLWREDKSCLPDDLPDNADEIVDKWVQEHPAKTYAMDFFEKFPNAQLDSYGAPRACVNAIYGLGDCSKSEISGIICRECWNQEMKEDG